MSCKEINFENRKKEKTKNPFFRPWRTLREKMESRKKNIKKSPYNRWHPLAVFF